MANFTHTVSYGYTKSGDSQRTKTITNTSGAETNVSETIAAAASNVQIVGFTLDISQIKSLYICASGAMTLKTNSSGAPQETITLAADEPLIWTADDPVVAIGDIFAGDVTALYVSSTPGGDLEIFVLYDPVV